MRNPFSGQPAPPLVTVVIACFNHGHFLRQALESVRSQTLENIETIVVDDGSTDDSSLVALQFAAANPAMALTVLRVSRGGPGRARNRGVVLSRSRYISCLDADDWFAPTALARMATRLEQSPKIAVIRPGVQNFGTRQDVWGRRPCDPSIMTYLNVAPACAMFRREVWVEVGGFDEAMDSYEDWDFWIAAQEHGYRMGMLPDALLNYRNSDEGRYASSESKDLALRARLVMRHPVTYSPPCREIARRILAGADVDDLLRDDSTHAIFTHSIRAMTLR